MKKEKYLKEIFYISFLMLLLIPLLFSLSFASDNTPQKPNKTIIVIDAGHGGKDTGSKSAMNLMEKEITLQLALSLKELLVKKPDMDIILTRSEDMEISPENRVSLANSKGANLFISLHVNASFDKREKGIEIYYYSKNALQSQNLPVEPGTPVIETQDKGSDYPTPLWSEIQNAFSTRSYEIAKIFENVLGGTQRLNFRSVKPARLLLLTGTTMPSLVIEAGFITNPEEASALADKEYMKVFSSKLADAISECFKEQKIQ